ncbi:glucosaminidase domain-containing protein [Cohnella hongkongensis]|uniref:Glucosaminidase domain-containing protein n=1 Tax=Cohnella hongkongensis TaxID=178337 RepID=A0ABV9FHY5_9BACL
MVKLSRAEFIARLAPIAIKVRREGSPLFPSVRLAQNLLETGGVIHPWNNLGGIKVGSGTPNAYWKGQYVRKGTWEVENGARVDTTALFRAYDSVYDFYKDQDLLLQLPRYERVRKAATPAAQAEALRLSGYATDPQYGSKIIALIQSNRLTQYDEEAEKPEPGNTPEPQPIPVSVRLNGAQLAEGRLIAGQTWVPARAVGEALQLRIGFSNKTVTANGKPLPTQLHGSVGYVPVRELIAIHGTAKLAWNQADLTVNIMTP